MLHPIKPALEQELLGVVALQRKVLLFACRSDLKIKQTVKGKPRFESAQVNAHFGAQADWVRSHYSLCEPVSTLNALVRGDAALRQQVVDAFNHDVEFDRHLDEIGFVFKVRRLPDHAFEPLYKLLVLFYDLLSEQAGFDAGITNAAPISRDTLVQAFWATNLTLKVCPACDGPKPDSTAGRVHGHCDHHLPKARYPTLSVHPLNLVPVCAQCNSTFKLQRDALEKACLAEMFLPFKRPVFGPARAVVARLPSGEIRVQIEDEPGAPVARIAALDHIYQLLDRWNGRLQGHIKDGIVNKARFQIQRWGGSPSENIAFQRDWFRSQRGQESDAILSEAYCTFATSDGAEIKAMSSQI